MLLEQITGQVERFTVTFVNTYLEKKVCDLFEKNLKHGEHLNVFIRVAGLGASCTFFFFFTTSTLLYSLSPSKSDIPNLKPPI